MSAKKHVIKEPTKQRKIKPIIELRNAGESKFVTCYSIPCPLL